MLADNALIYVNDFKDFAGITTNADDEIIADLIESATSYIEAYCKRKFVYDNSSFGVYTSASTPEESMYDGGECQIFLTQYPVISITSVYYVSDIATDGTITTTIFNAGDYIVNKKTGVLRKVSGVWAGGFQNIYVNFKAGYLFADLPAGIKQACREMVKILYFDRANNTNVARQKSPDYEEERRYNEQIPPWIVKLLAPYRRLGI